MKMQEIMKIIADLARSQGYYGRLYRALMTDKEAFEACKEEWEAQNFKDAVDFILYIES